MENTISVSEFAAVLGLDPKSSKEQVLARLASVCAGQSAGVAKPFKLSVKFKNREEYEELRRQKVRVRVTCNQPIAEGDGVYCPAELDSKGKVKTPADVFITDRARFRKIAWAVEEVPQGTPTTEERRAQEAKAKN